ncbi:cytochrome P450 10-like isoform X2 [Lingula anatina]|uniref:Cytochrome P450 10-like isoform X2 n=1 Tax=Lingula anatina TaxID=7574 RepID=A0A1S3HU51_LINAN|nr:cytochrome P450 10-like isoform X2 [Lingula anatina]|eukprot:XP_013389553.1 cytochrome P450 10-like isoform X2 [Lingula anatina]
MVTPRHEQIPSRLCSRSDVKRYIVVLLDAQEISFVCRQRSRMPVYQPGRWTKCGLYYITSRSYTTSATNKIKDPPTPHGAATHVPPARPLEEMPGPKGLPLLGNLLDYTKFGNKIISKLHLQLAKDFEKYGKIFKERLGPSTYMVYVSDPEDIATVFRKEGRYPVRGASLPLLDVYYKRTGKPLSLGMGDGKQWHDRRTTTQKKMLRPQAVQLYLSMQSQVTDDFMAYLQKMAEEKTELDIQAELVQYVMESIGTVCFNMRLNVLGAQLQHDAKERMFIQKNEELFALLGDYLFSLPFFKWFPTPLYARFEELYSFVLQFSADLVEKSLAKDAELRATEDSPQHFITDLVKDGESIETASDSAAALFIAGVESTSNSLAFLLYNLARNPDKQDKLRAEVTRVLPRDCHMTPEHLNRLPYMKACVKESMRLSFPVVLGATRILAEDAVLGGFLVPKGTCVINCNNASCLQSEYFPNPHAYSPERWMKEDNVQPHPYLLLPFGHGPRMCIGKRFAEQQMYIAISKLVQNFTIQHTGSEDIGITYTIFGKPDEPLGLTVTPRGD